MLRQTKLLFLDFFSETLLYVDQTGSLVLLTAECMIDA